MRKDDELALYAQLRPLGRRVGRQAVMDACELLDIHPNRAAYILGKWAGTRWYDYGVNVFCGWFEDGAPEQLPR